MSFRRLAAEHLGELLKQKLTLAQDPVVIAAPPSEVSEYPTVAIWLEKFTSSYQVEDELGLDASGNLRVGAVSEFENHSAAAKVAQGARLSKIGSIRATGRIWVGCSYPAKREEMEDQITELFVQDSSAIGRLMVTIPNPVVGGKQLPWSWNAAFFLSNSTWTDEYAFAERLWAWLDIEMEVDMLVLRTDPLMTEIVLSSNFQASLDEDAASVLETTTTEHAVVEADGSLSTYP